jgi:hypothetical protein
MLGMSEVEDGHGHVGTGDLRVATAQIGEQSALAFQPYRLGLD